MVIYIKFLNSKPDWERRLRTSRRGLWGIRRSRVAREQAAIEAAAQGPRPDQKAALLSSRFLFQSA